MKIFLYKFFLYFLKKNHIGMAENCHLKKNHRHGRELPFEKKIHFGMAENCHRKKISYRHGRELPFEKKSYRHGRELPQEKNFISAWPRTAIAYPHSRQNTQFNMYTTTSKQQEGCTFKDSHLKCFITTNFDKFHREAFARGGESR